MEYLYRKEGQTKERISKKLHSDSISLSFGNNDRKERMRWDGSDTLDKAALSNNRGNT